MADKLSTYQAKRDFTQTAEPQGAAAARRSDCLRFVIQKHDATRLHYDLRLELDGVFKSWAITRGPSLDPHDKRLAVEVEDHPLDYGDFEGTIPKGQYGGGTVQLWDRGYWAPQGMTAEEGLAKGDLKFTLEGEHLHGSWVLVRIKGWSGKRVNWLLIKHRDEHAHEGDADALLAEDRSVASGRSMADIAAGKGRAPNSFMAADGPAIVAKDAVWDSSVGLAPSLRAEGKTTRAAPAAKVPDRKKAPTAAAMPEFIEPQLCHSVERPPSGEGWLHEIKFDGYRVQVRIEMGRAVVRTRKGLDWTNRFGAIARACTALPDAHHRRRDRGADRGRGAGFRRAAGRHRRRTHRRLGVFRASTCCTPAPRTSVRSSWPNARIGCGRCCPLPPDRYCATSSTSTRAAKPSCSRPASCRWRGSSPSRPTPRTGLVAARPGPRPSAAVATNWSSAAGPIQAGSSAP